MAPLKTPTQLSTFGEDGLAVVGYQLVEVHLNDGGTTEAGDDFYEVMNPGAAPMVVSGDAGAIGTTLSGLASVGLLYADGGLLLTRRRLCG